MFRELVRRFPGGRYADRAAWKTGWFAYKDDRFSEAASTFEAAAVASPRANYRPSWLYWAARSHDHLGNEPAATALYRVVASDYLNSYYGRLAATRLDERGEATVAPIVVMTPAGASSVAPDPTAAVPNAEVIRVLASVELYDQALQEARYAARAWGASSALQATQAWLRYQRAAQPQPENHFADLRGAITAMRRAYPQFMAAGGERLPPAVLQVIFPLKHWPLIKKYSDAHELDPYLITALVAQESTFTVDVRSSANAVGLMQLIPGTARRYAGRLGIRYSSGILTQAETNIRLGMRYFKDLMNRFGGAHFALAGYNAGENRVSRWIRERPGFAQDEFIDDIPFPETQHYVKRILGTADDYRRLYDGGTLRTVPMPAVAGGRQSGPDGRSVARNRRATGRRKRRRITRSRPIRRSRGIGGSADRAIIAASLGCGLDGLFHAGQVLFEAVLHRAGRLGVFVQGAPPRLRVRLPCQKSAEPIPGRSRGEGLSGSGG